MQKRNIIAIDEKKCNGCGQCIPNCPEGAIQIIDGKARLISDIFCDGLGACLGHCPLGAISIQEREAEDYDERKAIENIVKQGKNTILAHLKHLKEHGETTYLKEAQAFLKENNIEIDFTAKTETEPFFPQGCPGATAIEFEKETTKQPSKNQFPSSQLRQWPVQMHLISPKATFFNKSDLVLAADCVAYAIGDFHQRFLSRKRLAIACPKLDSNKDIYLQKLISLIDETSINTLTVITMQVPCCQGLIHLAKNAVSEASTNIPLKHIMVSIKGEILKDEWI